MFLYGIEYPYKFVKVLKHQECIEKDTVTLLCELDDAAGDVKWSKNGQELKADKRYIIYLFSYLIRLGN